MMTGAGWPPLAEPAAGPTRLAIEGRPWAPAARSPTPLGLATAGNGDVWLTRAITFALTPAPPWMQTAVQGFQEIMRRHLKAAGRRLRDLRDPVRDVFEHVEPRDALVGEQLRRVRLVLLERRREHVARLHFLPAGALDVEDRGLEHAAERERLFRFLLLSARELLDRFLQVLVEVPAELRQVGAACREDSLAVRIVCQRVEQMLQRQMRVTARRGFPVRDRQHDFESWTEHGVA